MQDINDWAKAADPTNLLLFDAIGGNGKSMLTWEWTTKHATTVRSDWAGRFWYSFYERGAVMADFCRRALAYITRRPMDELEKMRTPELAKDLLAQLHVVVCVATQGKRAIHGPVGDRPHLKTGLGQIVHQRLAGRVVPEDVVVHAVARNEGNRPVAPVVSLGVGDPT